MKSSAGPFSGWGHELGERWGRWSSPSAKLRRARRRARRQTTMRGVATIALAWVTSWVGAAPGIELGEVFWGALTGLGAVSTGGAALRWWRLTRVSPPAVPVAAPLPPAGSVARAALERLAARERALADLLALLGPSAGDIAGEAAQGATALREYAARVVAVEAARAGAPAEARPGLDAAVATLRQRLEEGVSAYDRLVSAAAEAVSASSAPLDPLSLRRLEDAADALTGLARGLREVHTDG